MYNFPIEKETAPFVIESRMVSSLFYFLSRILDWTRLGQAAVPIPPAHPLHQPPQSRTMLTSKSREGLTRFPALVFVTQHYCLILLLLLHEKPLSRNMLTSNSREGLTIFPDLVFVTQHLLLLHEKPLSTTC